MLQPIPPRQGAAKACADQLRDAILRGELAAGSRLPPERSLAETLGVNRATVRIALHELESAGLVAARQGSGYSVRDFRAQGGPDLLGPLAEVARQTGSLAALAEDLLLVRRQLAAAVLERIAARELASSELDRIEKRIDDLETVVQTSRPLDAIAAADLAVLESLLDAAGSAVFRLFFNPAANVLRRLPELINAMYTHPEANILGWRALVTMAKARSIHVPSVIDVLGALDAQVVARLEQGENA